jgi:hypothetical protein
MEDSIIGGSLYHSFLVNWLGLWTQIRTGLFQSLITESIEEDAGCQKSALGMRHQRCYAVKTGLCGMLDVGMHI